MIGPFEGVFWPVRSICVGGGEEPAGDPVIQERGEQGREGDRPVGLYGAYLVWTGRMTRSIAPPHLPRVAPVVIYPHTDLALSRGICEGG